MDSTLALKPYKWLEGAVIFNKNNEIVPVEWIETNADIIVLLFTVENVDKGDIIKKFYEIYENVKFVNMPIEVIHVPMDESEESAKNSYEKQANWFTFQVSDPLVLILKYFYEVSSIPHLLVIKVDGTVISRHGILDLEENGKNAVISWVSNTSSTSKQRNFNKELSMYGKKWRYMNADPNRASKADYQIKFSAFPEEKINKLAA